MPGTACNAAIRAKVASSTPAWPEDTRLKVSFIPFLHSFGDWAGSFDRAAVRRRDRYSSPSEIESSFSCADCRPTRLVSQSHAATPRAVRTDPHPASLGVARAIGQLPFEIRRGQRSPALVFCLLGLPAASQDAHVGPSVVRMRNAVALFRSVVPGIAAAIFFVRRRCGRVPLNYRSRAVPSGSRAATAATNWLASTIASVACAVVTLKSGAVS